MEKKKNRKIITVLLIISAIAAAAAIYVLAVNAYVFGVGFDMITDTEAASSAGADYILVLGAGLRPDGSPSDMLTDRMKVAVELYEAGAAPKLLLSGDHSGSDYNEVGAMAKFATDAGVPEDALVLDGSGFSTYDSVERAKYIYEARSLVIVTQEYHLCRALYLADSFGINAVGVSADLRTYRGQAMRELREILARNKDFILSFT